MILQPLLLMSMIIPPLLLRMSAFLTFLHLRQMTTSRRRTQHLCQWWDECRSDDCRRDDCRRDQCRRDHCRRDQCWGDQCRRDQCRGDDCRRDECRRDECRITLCLVPPSPPFPKTLIYRLRWPLHHRFRASICFPPLRLHPKKKNRHSLPFLRFRIPLWNHRVALQQGIDLALNRLLQNLR
jgi:hypothetical protein